MKNRSNKKRILITTGLSATDAGGPAKYGPNLKRELEALGSEVRLAQYGSIESALISIWSNALWADCIIALDTFSVGVPSALAAEILGKKSVVRVGGDFLWETYVQRTGERITLRRFNESMPPLSFKERVIYRLTKLLVGTSTILAFNTEWQKSIWQKIYRLPESKCRIVKNFVPRNGTHPAQGKTFLWAGREIKPKNLELLHELSKEGSVEMVSGVSHEALQAKIKSAYVVVLPSYSDVCPNFVLEAASFGKPFIMTKETGLSEIYDKGGIFVDPFDIGAVRRAIQELSDSVRYERYKEELLSVDASRPWSEVAEEFIELCR